VTNKHIQKVKYDLVTDTYTIRDSKGNVIRVYAKVVEDAVDKKRS